MRTLSAILCTALFAGCSSGAVSVVPSGQTQNPGGIAGARVRPNAGGFALVYGFTGQPDGAFPLAPVVAVDGNLYGTTSQGGSVTANGNGTVYRLSTSGKEKVLHSFAGTPDGQFPQAGLTAVGGLLYGTTPNGGANANGSVFSSTKTGALNIAYSFGSAPDGANPTSTLISVGGVLYGTTLGGGGTSCNSGQGCGTVFSIDASGTETVLYRFQGGSDGQTPSSKLTYYQGTLYGTTFFGGGSGCNFRGCGTVFALSPSGSVHIVYSFKGSSDGANPSAGVITANGTLFGTTSSGGGNANDGTVFAINHSGKERVIHRFKGTADGADPEADLVAVKGTLYGTTFAGGANDFGTVFQMTRSGSETVVHDFTFGSDGGNPSAALVPFKGKLYGTAKTGGTAGFGTVYSIDL